MIGPHRLPPSHGRAVRVSLPNRDTDTDIMSDAWHDSQATFPVLPR